MNIFLENVDLKSNSGPNYFGQKLLKYMELRGATFDERLPYNLKLTFIESFGFKKHLPMFLRLDGIYFRSKFDCNKMNYNIKKTYEKAKGVIFQTKFNKNLIFKWFGEHPNYKIISNGSDLLLIESIDSIKPEQFKKFNKIWSCASNWHKFKRLEDNINYFLNFASKKDCLIVAGPSPDYIIKHPRIFYVGNLDIKQLFGVYKISDYFIHLASLDHCPNVVIDARTCGCKIICSSSGGTKEVAGPGAIVIEEEEWDYNLIQEPQPPELDFSRYYVNEEKSNISMAATAKKYLNFFKEKG
jgi:glycosyltransferase involved in cell wall biosynthesis